MTGAIAYAPMAGDRVEIALTGEDGRKVSAVLPGSYLRAKCWGILADIDDKARKPAKKRRPGAKALRQWERVLLALHGSELTTYELAAKTGLTPHGCSHLVSKLRREGMVKTRPTEGRQALHTITKSGRETVAKIKSGA